MARSAKTDTDKASPSDDIVDVVDGAIESPSDVPVVASDAIENAELSEMASTDIADSVLIVDPETPPVIEQAEEPVPFVAPLPNPESVTPPTEPAKATSAPRSTFLPLVLGGAVAAVLGFLAGWQFFAGNSGNEEAIAAQADRIAELASQIAALPAPTPAADLTPLTDEIANLRTETAPLAERLTALEDRIAGLERAPTTDGTLTETAIASWEAEIDALRTDIQEQEARMQTLADAASDRLDAAQSTVTEIEQNATASATSVLQRAAVSRMQAAVDTGTPFDAPLNDLTSTGVTVPDVLTAAALEGVPTVASLSETFPEVARAALATARAEGLADDGDGRVMSFLRSQFDVRSVTPREGDDPDAVLSRAEAALHDGRLSDSLAEVAALPEVVRGDMTGWITQAEERVAVIAALQSLSETLPATSN